MKIPLLFVAMIFFAACAPSGFNSPEELSRYVADERNNLSQSTEAGHYKVTVTHRPTDLLVSQELGKTHATGSLVEALRRKYSPYYYFVVSLATRDDREMLHSGLPMEGYSELVQILSFQMGTYVNLTTPNDTIAVSDYMLNRTYGFSQSTDLLFVFNKETVQDQEWVQLNLNEFGLGIGNQRFRFKTEYLDEAPLLKFKIDTER